nr:hypothetical protein GCM10020093_001310 [Planobispora longispora]
MGLWVARMVSSDIAFRTGAEGTVITMRFAVPPREAASPDSRPPYRGDGDLKSLSWGEAAFLGRGRPMTTPPRILIVGGGYVGMYTALRLQRRLRRGEARVTVVDADSYMTYQPFLPEAAAGNVEPRHVVVPSAESCGNARSSTAG